MTEHDETVKYVIDGVSFLTVVGTLAEALPAVAATFTIIWTSIRIWETKTVQGWLNNKKAKDAIDE
jgi:hypothetical protein